MRFLIGWITASCSHFVSDSIKGEASLSTRLKALHSMTNDKWLMFFRTCNRVLGSGASRADLSANWCAWTTFDSLQDTLVYWSAGLPTEEFLAEDLVRDNGPWGQPFAYQSIAHIVIPRIFYWEIMSTSGFKNGRKNLDLDRLSQELKGAGIEHRITDLVLEIKLY